MKYICDNCKYEVPEFNGYMCTSCHDGLMQAAIIQPHDPVTKPQGYTHGPIECIDAIRSALTPEEFAGFCKGNVLKYIWREKFKGGAEDLEKAKVYLGWVADPKSPRP